jgi:hypothetical protein
VDYWTVRLAIPCTIPEVAVMVVDPVVRAFASPVLEIVAAAGLLEVQVTEAEISFETLSAYVPVAVYCRAVPALRVELAGVTVIDVSGG